MSGKGIVGVDPPFVSFVSVKMALFLVAGVGQFREVREAREAFLWMRDAFLKYESKLGEAAPVYDPSLPPGGPPFDMWHNLEMLDRGAKSFLETAEEWEAWWDELGMESFNDKQI